jgi:hypothetical protein
LVQCRNHEFDIAHRIAAGPAGDVEHGVMLRGLVDRRDRHDLKADRLSAGLVTVPAHDQLPALRLGEGGIRSQLRRAGAGLEARHVAGRGTPRRCTAKDGKNGEEGCQRGTPRPSFHRSSLH